MISDERIAMALEYIECGFSNRYISGRTGISRAIITEIRMGRRKEGLAKKKADYAHKNNLSCRAYDQITREAREALVKSGRESAKVLTEY